MKKLKDLSTKQLKRRLLKEFREKLDRQTTFLLCSDCETELISSNSFVSDEDLVSYKCAGCGRETKWNFDIAPVPILIK